MTAAARTLNVAIVAGVLAVAWHAGREELGMGIAVAIVGLVTVYTRPLLALPAAAGMAAAVLHVSGVTAVLVFGLIMILCGSRYPGGRGAPSTFP